MVENDYDQFIEQSLRVRYPSGIPVFYKVDDLEKAIRDGDVTGPVGLVYHAISPPSEVGQSSIVIARNREQLEQKLKLLSHDIIVLIALDSFMSNYGWHLRNLWMENERLRNLKTRKTFRFLDVFFASVISGILWVTSLFMNHIGNVPHAYLFAGLAYGSFFGGMYWLLVAEVRERQEQKEV